MTVGSGQPAVSLEGGDLQGLSGSEQAEGRKAGIANSGTVKQRHGGELCQVVCSRGYV